MNRVTGFWVSVTVVCVPISRAATPGFIEHFSSGTGGFAGGATYTHVPNGGLGGASDGYLEMSRTLDGFLGGYTQAAEFTGDLVQDGVTGFSFWLQDTGADENLEIHVGVGVAPTNYWMSVQGFSPPTGSWQQFSVSFANPGDWVQTHGSGTFQDALANSDRLLFRHDFAPIISTPDTVVGAFGLDRIAVLPTAPALGPLGLCVLLTLVVAAGVMVVARRRGAFA